MPLPQMLPDGRSLVSTTGVRRFRVLSRDVQDGYHVAAVEWLQDDPLALTDMPSYVAAVADARHAAAGILDALGAVGRQRVVSQIGEPPEEDDHLAFWSVPRHAMP